MLKTIKILQLGEKNKIKNIMSKQLITLYTLLFFMLKHIVLRIVHSFVCGIISFYILFHLIT